MKCKKIQKRLSAFMDGELERLEHERFQAHLQNCKRCQEQLALLSRVDWLLDDAPDMPAQPFFLSRLQARLCSEKSQPLSLHLAWAYSKFLAPAAVVVGLGLGALLGIQLARNFNTSAETTVVTESITYTDVFSDAPSGSLTESYLDLNK